MIASSNQTAGPYFVPFETTSELGAGHERHPRKWSLHFLLGVSGSNRGEGAKGKFHFLLYGCLYCLNVLTMSTHLLFNNKIK